MAFHERNRLFMDVESVDREYQKNFNENYICQAKSSLWREKLSAKQPRQERIARTANCKALIAKQDVMILDLVYTKIYILENRC